MLVPALVFLAGLCVGSFLNVVILRTREGTSFVGGRSRCMSCEVELGPAELVPVLSYVALRGRCRSCAAPISMQYPLVEFFTGILFLAFFFHDASWALFARDVVFVAFLVIVFVYDLRYMEILDRFTVPAMGVALLANIYLGMDPRSLVVGAAVIGGFFLVQYAISRGRWIGAGDIRMGFLMGFMLGLPHGLAALFLAYLVGALFGIFLIATKRADGKTPLPFGTFLALATVAVLLFGTQIVDWYLGWIVA